MTQENQKSENSPFGAELEFIDVPTRLIADPNSANYEFQQAAYDCIILSRIDGLPNAELLTDKNKDLILILARQNIDVLKKINITDDGDFHLTDEMHFVQDEFKELFEDEFMAISPYWLRNHASCFYATSKVEPATRDGWIVSEIDLDSNDYQQKNSDGKTLNDYCSNRANFNISLKDLEENTNYQGSFRSGRTRNIIHSILKHERNFEIQNGMSYRAYLMQAIKKAVYEHIDNLEPKTKKKAEYKNKTYKNTAKQAKPSPILMSLINRKP
ncbi:hypothetical protein LP085_08065 [Achromobacter sp. MY14]|uniref:hypothetical protein n=1 Tax=unclassified Achromobacter TaxID=2626865 RepID=UPI001E2EFD8D|nr:hypothetical protein [Achromobacter sp. MY14]MCD0496801.1 hypothetical protein [Achromobacter sp. MY14]